MPLSPARNEGYSFHFRQSQLSIQLSFAMTINKVQDQIISYVGVYLPQNVFLHDQ